MKTCVILLTALAAMAQAPAGPVARCRDAKGNPCTQKQVQTLSDAVFAGKRQHDVLALFKELTLANANGTLRCVQNDGSACLAAQLDIVKEIAAAQDLYVNYNSSAPKKGK